MEELCPLVLLSSEPEGPSYNRGEDLEHVPPGDAATQDEGTSPWRIGEDTPPSGSDGTGPTDSGGPGDTSQVDTPVRGCTTPGQMWCEGNVAHSCNAAGTENPPTDCQQGFCLGGECLVCPPNENYCVENQFLQQCNADGSAGTPITRTTLSLRNLEHLTHDVTAIA